MKTILSDENPEQWDLYKDGERIWCGATDLVSNLKYML